MTNKILITTSSFSVEDNPALQRFRERSFDILCNPFGRKLSETESMQLLTPEVVGLIAGVEALTEKVLKAASGLKVISRCGIGMDNVDLEAAQALGIKVFNTPQAPVNAVAEFTLGLILSLLRQVHRTDYAMRQGQFKKIMGELLTGKTVGIIGFGRIGRQVATLAQAFGATVIAHDIGLNSLEDVMKTSDIISIHVPYNTSTHHLIDASLLALMKPSAYLVNAARGGIVDEKALYQALKSNRMAGAALDCFEAEPYGGELTQLDNVLLTAHMGSYAKEARVSMEREAANHLLQALT